MARLGDVCVKKVDTIKATYKGNIDYIDISSVDNQRKEITQIQSMAFEDAPSRAKQLVYAGDILVSTVRPNLNAVALIAEDSDNTLVASTGYCVLRCLPNADKKYVFYFCQSNGFIEKLVTQATGASYPAVTSSIVKECSIPLPPLEEQRKIAVVLDKVCNLIAKRRQQLDKLDEMVKAKFVEMFGDPVVNPYRFPMVKLGSVLTVEPQNGLYKPQSDYVVDGSGIPILRIDGFYNGKVTDFQKLKRLLCSDEEIQKFLLHENDIVINRVNSIEYLGKCGLIQGLLEETVYESNMMRLHIDESKFNVHYIVHLLCSQFIYNQILGKAKKSVNQASINQKDVQGLMVYIPALALQNQFSAFVEQTEKTKTTINRSLEKLETLKKALMQEYFG